MAAISPATGARGQVDDCIGNPRYGSACFTVVSVSTFSTAEAIFRGKKHRRTIEARKEVGSCDQIQSKTVLDSVVNVYSAFFLSCTAKEYFSILYWPLHYPEFLIKHHILCSFEYLKLFEMSIPPSFMTFLPAR